MQTCSNCGASVREGARFCTACGTQMNEASPETSAFSWGAAVDEPSAEPASTDAAAAWPTRGADGADEAEDVASETPNGESETGDSDFTWTWNAPPADEPPASTDVEEESGVVIEQGEPDANPADVVEATEIDILAPDASSSDASVADAEADGTSDHASDVASEEDLLIVASEDEIVVEEDVDSSGAETLAAWATGWDSPGEDNSGAIDEALAQVADSSDNDDEDTVAKAERLIAELQSMLPRLVNPKPATPEPVKPRLMLADELERVDDGSDWSDLRQVLERARDNPRDILHVMSISDNVERLIHLLDQRDNLARTAANVASRLRNPDPDEA